MRWFGRDANGLKSWTNARVNGQGPRRPWPQVGGPAFSGHSCGDGEALDPEGAVASMPLEGRTEPTSLNEARRVRCSRPSQMTRAKEGRVSLSGASGGASAYRCGGRVESADWVATLAIESAGHGCMRRWRPGGCVWTGDVQVCRGGGRAGPRIEPAQVNGDLVPHQIQKKTRAHEKTPHREDAGLRKYSGDNLLSHLAALSSALAA